METKELENCIRIIGGYWLHEDENVISELLNKDQNINIIFSEPFYKELNKNLLSIESRQGKEDLIRFYISQFWELQGFYKEYKEILFDNPYINYNGATQYISRTKEGDVKLGQFENYVIVSWILFDILFNEIQIICFTYNINFLAICKDLHFDIQLLGSWIIFDEQKEDVNKLNIYGFKSSLEPQHIKYLFNQLKGKYIDINTNTNHFEIIFNSQPLPRGFEPLKWIKPKNLLAYFIDQLQINNYINDYEFWSKAKKLFEDANNLKQIKRNYLNNKTEKPKNSDQIDTIIKNLK
jgi:hypothetical protein